MSGHSKWANIKHKKGRVDAIRGKITTKIGREITIAVKLGGPDQTGNMRLKLALQKAKANNVPKENIQRAIQKGQGALEGANYEEFVYEGYGPAGVAVMIDILTDNRNRTAADIRHIFSKHGGNLGESGCVSWMFKQKGVFVVESSTLSEEDLMMMVLDAGAEDLKNQDGTFEITTAPADFEAVQQVLEANHIECVVAEITMVPETFAELNEADSEKMMNMLEILEEHDDVQNVYSNFDMPEEPEED